MLRLLTQKLPETAFQTQRCLVRQLSSLPASSYAAPLLVTSPNTNSKHVFLKQSFPLKISNQCVFHTSSSNYNFQNDFKKQLKFMLSQVDWREAKSSPQPALVLGAAGLIPFVMPPVYILLDGAFLPTFAAAQLAYGAVILSFLGGVKWGFAVPDQQNMTWKNLGVSVSLALTGWTSLIISPWIGNLVLIGALGASAYVDITSPGYPQWFKAMRLCLSTVAMGSLALTFVLRILF